MKNSWKKTLLVPAVALCFGLFQNDHASARVSEATNKGTGPLYWISYEHQFKNNTYMPEDLWKKNIDWMAKNFQPYGYDMISTDGWIEGSTKHTKNGYILSHNDSWKHDWKYWGKYIHAKKMKLGIYYNPLWVTPAAVENENATVIGRPDIKIKDIINKDDRFNGGQKNSLYWVDVTKDGAKEYIQGYVKYFKNQGASFLRVDFLSWYETGTDKNLGTVGKAHGRKNYETALKWMEQAAGKDMNLSLVMPHLKDHGKAELKYGDMVRIDEDVFNGGWDHISGRRQAWTDSWSQWANAFQGFTGFADISGRNSMILDGDFLRMNTFSGNYASREKKSAVSLFTMAGSPIAIADQFNTIGKNEKYYQNEELLELNKLGFVGKPIFKSKEHYKYNTRDSERWVGQLPDGSWVVGLFNRSDYTKSQTIDFKEVLGFKDDAFVRDMWKHKDLGLKKGYSVTLKPHDSKVIKVIPATEEKKYEAEVASYQKGASFNNLSLDHTGFGFIENMDKIGAALTIPVSVTKADEYRFTINYANGEKKASTKTLEVNGEKQQVTFAPLKNWDTWGKQQVKVNLKEGENLVTLSNTKADRGNIRIDSLSMTDGSSALINGDFELANHTGWEIWNPNNAAAGVDSNDAHQGFKHYFYKSEPFEARISQKLSGITNGTYNVSGWVKLQPFDHPEFNGKDDKAQMEISGQGVSEKNVEIKPEKPTFAWKEFKQNVDVPNGELNIGFYVNAPGNTSFQLDDVKLTKAKSANDQVLLYNGNFNQGMDHWTTSNLPASQLKSDGKNKYLRLTSKNSFASRWWQFAQVKEGTYTLKAKVRNQGNIKKAVLFADENGKKTERAITGSTKWKTVEIKHLKLNKGVVKVGTHMIGTNGGKLDIDQIELKKEN